MNCPKEADSYLELQHKCLDELVRLRGRIHVAMNQVLHEHTLDNTSKLLDSWAEESHVLSIGIIRWGARECGQISGNQFF